MINLVHLNIYPKRYNYHTYGYFGSTICIVFSMYRIISVDVLRTRARGVP
jgi:hypothetical protein